MSEIKHHPLKGDFAQITKGPLKGKSVKIIDYMRAQFQNKRIERLMKSQGALLAPVKRRGYPLDDDLVFVQMMQTREFICVHDDELKNEVKEPDFHGPASELRDNVTPITKKVRKKKDETK